MATYPTLRQWSDERAQLVQSALPRAGAVILGRRALTGIQWRNNLIVTAAEAIGGAERAVVRLENGELEAEVIATDLSTDVAILQVAVDGAAKRPPGDAIGGSKPATASASPATAVASAAPLASTPRAGEAIVMVSRTAHGPNAIWGSVQLAGPAWSSRRGGRIDQRLEFDIGFQPAFEGAPVIDMDGALIAMAVPGPYRKVLGIPAQTIEAVVAKVEKNGRLPRPYIGVRLQSLWLDDDARAQLGRTARAIAAVGGVDAGSPAANAHIELGDLLLTLDGESAESVTKLAQRIASTTPGQVIALEVLRGGKPLVINVEVAERPRH
jgi:S1-C subfamily serine protease